MREIARHCHNSIQISSGHTLLASVLKLRHHCVSTSTWHTACTVSPLIKQPSRSKRWKSRKHNVIKLHKRQTAHSERCNSVGENQNYTRPLLYLFIQCLLLLSKGTINENFVSSQPTCTCASVLYKGLAAQTTPSRKEKHRLDGGKTIYCLDIACTKRLKKYLMDIYGRPVRDDRVWVFNFAGRDERKSGRKWSCVGLFYLSRAVSPCLLTTFSTEE